MHIQYIYIQVLDVVVDLDASADAVRAEGLAAREGVAAACLHLHRLVEKKKEALLAQVEQEEESRAAELAGARKECQARLRLVSDTLELVEQVRLECARCEHA